MQKQPVTVKKSLDILELFAQVGAPLSVKEISSYIRLPGSTVYRYISTLSQRGYIEYDPSIQKYRLGMNLIRLGHIATRQIEVHRVAYPIMEQLAQKAGETVILTLTKGINGIVVEVVDSGRAGIKLAMNQGDTIPLCSCALTRPLMAYLPKEEIDSILRTNPPKRFTEYTITDADAIRNELKKVRRQGYAYSDQEITVGARGIGAPVRDYSRTVVATLSLSGSLHNFPREKIPDFVKLLLEATEQCSLKMGFTC